MNKPDHKASFSDPANWVNLHADILFRYAMKYVHTESIAEDLVQDTFLAALKGKNSFSGQSSEQTWFIGILKNKIMDYFRKSSREINVDLADRDVIEQDDNFIQSGKMKGTWQPSKRPAKWNIDPNDTVEQKEFWIHLNNCLEGIDDKLAKIYRLREIEEIDYKLICNTFNLSHTNLRVMLYRARKLLRICLEKNWIDTGGIK